MEVDKNRKLAGTHLDRIKQAASKTFSQIKTVVNKAFKFDINHSQALKNRFSKKIVNKKRFLISCSSIALLAVIGIYIWVSGTAYAMKINDVEIGKVKNQKVAEAAIQTFKQKLQEQNKCEISFTSGITYTKSRASKKELLQGAELEEALKKSMKYSLQAFSIYVNGNPVATLKSKGIADAVLKEIQDIYLKTVDQTKLKEIGFAEKVEVKAEFTELGKIMEKEDTVSYLAKGTNEIKLHTIESGESFWSISKKYKMSLQELERANPGVDSEKIKIGQTLNLIMPKPLVSVKTVETVTAIENVPYEQKVELTDTMYKDETRVKVKGQYGEKEVVADVIRVNGLETGRTILSEKPLKDPKAEIIVKGTKALPPKKGTGTFSFPSRGSITSRFGLRWGRRHEGIDIGAPVGTPVRASDGGVVIWVGTDGGYGKLVKVDHGAGYISYYGHLSKYYVSVGQKVYKGQKIAAVGNTGRSTGPHLHFEIRKNGVPKNPLSYLK